MIKKGLDIIEKIIMIVMGILMGAMVLVIFYQVALRYLASSATTWADELARFMMIWVVMLAAPIGFRRYRHINIDVVIRYFSPKVRKIVDLCMNILLIIFLTILFIHTLSICETVQGQISQSSGIPQSFMYSSVAVSSVLSIVVILENIYNELFAGKKGKEREQE